MESVTSVGDHPLAGPGQAAQLVRASSRHTEVAGKEEKCSNAASPHNYIRIKCQQTDTGQREPGEPFGLSGKKDLTSKK